MTFCTDSILTAEDGPRKHARAIRCKSWTCELCAPERRTQLIATVIGGCPQRLITLTSRRREGVTAEQAAIALVHAWRVIRRAITREHGKRSCEFIAVFEQTKLGWPHLHIAQHGHSIDQAWLSAQMDRLTDSPVTDIRAVTSKRGTARYVSKYISKAPGKFGGLKRYYASRHYCENREWKERIKQTWSREQKQLPRWVQELRWHGWHALMVSQFEAKATAPGVHVEAQQ